MLVIPERRERQVYDQVPAGQAAYEGAVDHPAVPVAHHRGFGRPLCAEWRSVQLELLDQLVQAAADGIVFREPVELLGGRVDCSDSIGRVGRHDRVRHLLDDDAADASGTSEAPPNLGVAALLPERRRRADGLADVPADLLQPNGVQRAWLVSAPQQDYRSDAAAFMQDRGRAQGCQSQGPGPPSPVRGVGSAQIHLEWAVGFPE